MIHDFHFEHYYPNDVPYGPGSYEPFENGHDNGPQEPSGYIDYPGEQELVDQPEAETPGALPEPEGLVEGGSTMDRRAVDTYLELAERVHLDTGDVREIPAVGGPMLYTRPDYNVTRSNKEEHTLVLFGDQYTGTTEVGLHLEEDQSGVVAGGLDATFARGQVVLFTGSAEAVALLEYSQDYPDAVIIGVDINYAEIREIDTETPGVQLTQDDWDELRTIRTGSVDRILSVLGPERHGQIREDNEDRSDFIDAWDRVASDNGTIRFYIGMPWMDSVPVSRIRERLESLGWEVTIHAETAIARRRSNEQIVYS